MSTPITDRATSTESGAIRYQMTREVETAGRVVRVVIRRGRDHWNSFAVADVLTDAGTWHRLADVPPELWINGTPRLSDTIDVTAALGALAERLVVRSCELITSPPQMPHTVPAHVFDAMGALLATGYSYGGECRVTGDTIEWARTHGGPFRIIEEPDGTVTFTKAHRAACPYVASSGAQECDDECYFD